jgi:MFS family permease
MKSSRVLLFLVSRLASALGDQFLLFAVPLIVYRATGSVTMSGLAFSIEWLPRIIALPIAGALADRLGGWRVYATADTIRALACLSAALAIASAPDFAFAIAASLMALCAVCYAHAFISLESTVPILVGKDQMPKAQSLLQAIDHSASIAGPATAALLSLWLQSAQLLWIAFAVFGVSAAGVWGLRIVLRPAAASAVSHTRNGFFISFFKGMAEAAGILRTHRILISMILLSMAVNLVVGMALATGAAITVGKFGQPDSLYACLQGAMGILSLLSFALVPILVRHVSVYGIGIVSFGLIVTGGLMMTVAPSFPWFVGGYALAYGPCGLFNVFIRTERLHWIPADKLGRVISLIVLLNQLTLPIAGLLATVAGDRMQPQWLFLVVSLIAATIYLGVRHSIHSRAHTARMQDVHVTVPVFGARQKT